MRISDWSSDVCSSDLRLNLELELHSHGSDGLQPGAGVKLAEELFGVDAVGIASEAGVAEHSASGAAGSDFLAPVFGKPSFDTGDQRLAVTRVDRHPVKRLTIRERTTYIKV